MKELIRVIKKLSIVLCEFLYVIKDIIVLIVMSIISLSMSTTKTEKSVVILMALITFWVCMVLRQLHNEYKKLMRKEMTHKRYTYLDENGNPTIKVEDLPEIVEYLYRLEETGDVKTREGNKGA